MSELAIKLLELINTGYMINDISHEFGISHQEIYKIFLDLKQIGMKFDKKYYEESEYEYTECKTKKNIKAPSSVTATLNGEYNDVLLSWKKSTGADGYNVYYKLGTGAYEFLADTTALKTEEAAEEETEE